MPSSIETSTNSPSHSGWEVGRSADANWLPWGADGLAEAHFMTAANDTHMVHIRANAGYQGDPHDHAIAEFTYVLSGRVVTNGIELGPGDGVAAECGTRHESFKALTDTEYIVVFSL